MKQRQERRPVRKCSSCLLNLRDHCWLHESPRKEWDAGKCPSFENEEAYAEFRKWKKEAFVPWNDWRKHKKDEFVPKHDNDRWLMHRAERERLTRKLPRKAVLVRVTFGKEDETASENSLTELQRLADTARFVVADRMVVRRTKTAVHGLIGKQSMYDHSMRVPMMVCGPSLPKNKKLGMPVYLQDIMPSTLELAGAKKPGHVQFKSLMPLISGKKKSSYDAVYGAYKADLQRMVIAGDYKLIIYPAIRKIKLFNLKDDPMEMINLAQVMKYEPVIARLFKAFVKLQKETGDTLKIDISEYSAKGIK